MPAWRSWASIAPDGLAERRPERGGCYVDMVDDNTARLASALADAGDPEMACIRALAEVVGDHIAKDDIAILVAHIGSASSAHDSRTPRQTRG